MGFHWCWERVCGERPVGMVQTFFVQGVVFFGWGLTLCFESGVRDFWGMCGVWEGVILSGCVGWKGLPVGPREVVDLRGCGDF